MRNLYRITKGQLICLWIFGLIGLLAAMGQVDYSDSAIFFVVLIPAILIFYTIGWKNYNKNSIDNFDFRQKMIAKVSKKSLIKGLILSAIIVILVYAAAKIYDSKEQAKDERSKRETYIGLLNRYSKYYENAQTCINSKVDEFKGPYTNECKARYDKAYASYKDCRKDMYWQDHYDCINWPGSNYEAIDCSSETIIAKIKSVYGLSCNIEVNTVYLDIISYEENLTKRFLESQQKTKSSFTSDELQKLYATFPQEVFNQATKERLNKFIQEQGYEILP